MVVSNAIVRRINKASILLQSRLLHGLNAAVFQSYVGSMNMLALNENLGHIHDIG